MKKIKIIFVILFIFNNTFSQGFAEIGTNWKIITMVVSNTFFGKNYDCYNVKVDTINKIDTINSNTYTKINNINFGVWNDSLFYEYNQKPFFLLSYKAKIGDTIKVKLMPNFLTFTGFYNPDYSNYGNILVCNKNTTTVQLVFVVTETSTINKKGNILRRIKHKLINSSNYLCENKGDFGFYGWEDFIEKVGMSNPIGTLFKYDYFSNKSNRTEDNIEFQYYREYTNANHTLTDTIGNLICTPLNIKSENQKSHQIKYNSGNIEITNFNSNEIIMIYEYLGNKTIELKSIDSIVEIKNSVLKANMLYILVIYNPNTRNKYQYKIINNY